MRNGKFYTAKELENIDASKLSVSVLKEQAVAANLLWYRAARVIQAFKNGDKLDGWIEDLEKANAACYEGEIGNRR